MDKIIVEVYFPSLCASFDIEINITARFHIVADLIEKAVSSITGGRYVPSGEAILCDRDSGLVFDVNLNANQLCLFNGSRLMMI